MLFFTFIVRGRLYFGLDIYTFVLHVVKWVFFIIHADWRLFFVDFTEARKGVSRIQWLLRLLLVFLSSLLLLLFLKHAHCKRTLWSNTLTLDSNWFLCHRTSISCRKIRGIQNLNFVQVFFVKFRLLFISSIIIIECVVVFTLRNTILSTSTIVPRCIVRCIKTLALLCTILQ